MFETGLSYDRPITVDAITTVCPGKNFQKYYVLLDQISYPSF